jgi:hypothetical protein
MTDNTALASSVGFLPETSLGSPIEGTVVSSGPFAPGTTTLPISGQYSPKDIIGMQIEIRAPAAPSGEVYVVEDYNQNLPGSPDEIVIYPGARVTINDADEVWIYCIPFPHRLNDWECEEEYNRDNWGNVGDGIVSGHVSQAGREANVSSSGIKGRDLLRHMVSGGPMVFMEKSSLYSHLYTDDGEFSLIPDDRCQVDFRQTSDAPSQTYLWYTKVGEIRGSFGTVISSGEETRDEGQDAYVAQNWEMSAQYADDLDETWLTSKKILMAPAAYDGPLMKAHGSSRQRWQHGTRVATPQRGGLSSDYRVYSVWGFEVNDVVRFTDKYGNEEVATIANVTPTGMGEHDIVELSAPLAMNVEDSTTWMWHGTGVFKDYSVKSMTTKTISGHNLSGDVSKPYDYRTNKSSNAFAIEQDVTFRRNSLVQHKMSKRDCYGVRVRHHISEYENEMFIGVTATMLRSAEYGLINPVTEKLTGEVEEMEDELQLRLVDPSPILELMRVSPPF